MTTILTIRYLRFSQTSELYIFLAVAGRLTGERVEFHHTYCFFTVCLFFCTIECTEHLQNVTHFSLDSYLLASPGGIEG